MSSKNGEHGILARPFVASGSKLLDVWDSKLIDQEHPRQGELAVAAAHVIVLAMSVGESVGNMRQAIHERRLHRQEEQIT